MYNVNLKASAGIWIVVLFVDTILQSDSRTGGITMQERSVTAICLFSKQRKPLISRTRLACRVASLESCATRAYVDMYCDNTTWMHLRLYTHEHVCLRYMLCLGIEMMNVMLTQNTLKNACRQRTVLHLVSMKYL